MKRTYLPSQFATAVAQQSCPKYVNRVKTDGAPISSFGPVLTPPRPLADSARCVRRPSPPSGETDTGSDATRNDKHRRAINGNDSSEVQIIKGEQHQVELETELRLRRFACSVGDCRRRYGNIDKLLLHYQHSGAHGTIGLESLASGQHKWLQNSESTALARQSIAVHCATTPPTSPSPTKSAKSQSRQQGFGQSQHLPHDVLVVNTLSPPTQENIAAAPPVPPDMQSLHPSTQKYVSTSQSSPSRIPAPPDKLHLTLFCLIKKMNKLSRLIDHLQKLASSASPEYRSQLSIQAIALRARLKIQRERCMEFLQLGEENANRYLLGIDTEIQQQSKFLDKLEGRLGVAKKLHGEYKNL